MLGLWQFVFCLCEGLPWGEFLDTATVAPWALNLFQYTSQEICVVDCFHQFLLKFQFLPYLFFQQNICPRGNCWSNVYHVWGGLCACVDGSSLTSCICVVSAQYCVTRGRPSFYCCVTFLVANYSHGQVATTGAMSSLSMPGIFCAYHVYRQTWTPFVGERLQ